MKYSLNLAGLLTVATTVVAHSTFQDLWVGRLFSPLDFCLLFGCLSELRKDNYGDIDADSVLVLIKLPLVLVYHSATVQ